MHIRIDYRNGGKRHVAYCSEYHKGKAKNPKCHSPHIIDADLLMQTVAEVLKKIEDYRTWLYHRSLYNIPHHVSFWRYLHRKNNAVGWLRVLLGGDNPDCYFLYTSVKSYA